MATALQKAKVLVIAGTTAVGKTDLSLELVKRLNGEIISADSVQVYRNVDIGSAKVEQKIMDEVPHHLINIVDIKDNFSAGDFFEQTKSTIEDIVTRGKVPIIVGGTSFYLSVLLSCPSGSPVSTDESREAIEKYIQEDNGDWVKSLARLKALDPIYAASLHVNDWYRLKRALDICLQSGRTVTSYKRDPNSPSSLDHDFKCLFLTMPRVPLFHRIDLRCEQIISNGLLRETAILRRHHGLKLGTLPGSSIGYRQSLEYIAQEWDSAPSDISGLLSAERKEAFLDYLFDYQAKTRQLAQRQLVWFKKESQFHWLNMCPDGQRLPLSSVADGVISWFNHGTELPAEWNGRSLMTLSDEEVKQLKIYNADQYKRLKIYNKDKEIVKTLTELQTCLYS